MASSLEKWQSVTQDPRVVRFFLGLFERLGVRVIDTGEEFTCHHRDDRIEFAPGLAPADVDYAVEIQSFQVDRLAEHASRGELDALEQYRILRALFTPATAATLKNPILGSSLLRHLAGSSDLIHVSLMPPSPEEEPADHTLICAEGQWLVIPGLHGSPRLTIAMTTEQALEFQRRLFATMKADTWPDWLKFSLWYRQWRRRVTVSG